MDFPDKTDLPYLKKMFTHIFSEETSFVDMMFQNKLSLDNTFIIRADEKIVSMAYTMYFDCKIGDCFGKCVYIYGVGTNENYRGKGYMTKIMSNIYEFYSRKDILFLYLVPAEPSLFKMYEGLGYQTAFHLDKNEIEIKESRNIHLSTGDFHADYLHYIKKFQNVIIRSALDNHLILNECKYLKVNESGFLFCINNKTACIREAYIYDERDLCDFLAYLGSLSIKKAEIIMSGSRPYAMIRPISDDIKLMDFQGSSYTNLNFD